MERDGLPLFAIRLREHRTGRDYSLAEVAHRLRVLSRDTGDGIEAGVTPQRAWRREQGERPRARYRSLLCAFYAATPAELGFEDPAPPHDGLQRRDTLKVIGAATIAPLAELGAADEACALGHQPLDSTRVVKSVRTRARELDVVLRRQVSAAGRGR